VLVFVAWIALAGLGATLGGRQRGRSWGPARLPEHRHGLERTTIPSR